MSRRRAASPTPAEIRRILRGIARDERIAQRRSRARYRALERRFRREREARMRAEAALAQKFPDEEAERKRQQAEWDQERAEWDREQAELKREEAERDWKLDETLNRIAGDGDARWGQLRWALVGGDLVKVLRGAGVDVEFLGERVRTRKLDGECREYDVVAAGKTVVVVVEMQPTLCEADVNSFLSRLGDFREWRPDYARPRMFGAVGYLTAKGNATRAAEAAGFYLMRAVGSSASIVNSEGFEPRLY